MKTIRLTMAQAVVRYLANQRSVRDGKEVPLFAGVWAIFGHGNVAGIGEALYHAQDTLPTFRAHNEQAMAHSAIAFAKAARRRQMMACTTSIGPGATNMVTAAAVAHVDRLPVLLLPGDIFANRRPDPVLQQVEDFGDGTVSANDCFKPVSRYFDRILRPEQILTALPRALQVLTDPAECGPVTLCMCQDVQAEAYDYPEAFFEEHVWGQRRIEPDRDELAHAVSHLKRAKKPFIVSGGGVLYSEAEKALADFAEKRGIPVAETQAGKSALTDAPQAEHGLDRRDRQQRRQRAGAGSGCGARHRHAAAGFHHRIARPVPHSGPQDHQPQRPGLRCRQAWRHPAGDRCARRHRRDRQGAGRLVGAGRLAEAGGSGAQDLDRGTCRGNGRAQSRAAVRRRR